MNRRSFLRVTAGVAATTTFLPYGQAAAPKRNLRKAIMYSTIGMKGTVLEKFRAMKEAGFDGVEPMGGMNRDEVLAAFKATGLQAASVCCHTHWEKPLSQTARWRHQLARGDEGPGQRRLQRLGDFRAARQPGRGRGNRPRPGAADGPDSCPVIPGREGW
jgi:hypothetical protein